MAKSRWFDWTAIALIIVLAVFYAWTLMDIPFHPDESTHLYMSKDLSSYFQNPLELAWDGDLPPGEEERIRAIDAPLANYLIGVVRGIFSVPALEADWDWRLSWEENQAAGATPSREQLLFARAALTAVLPFCLWFFYRALSKNLSGTGTLVGTLLLGLHPLLFLHGRRAMSEALLLLGICFFLWAATRDQRNPWLIGFSLGLAVGAKHSAIALLPAGILSVILIPGLTQNLKKAGGGLLKLSLVLFITTLLLNPFYWKRPLSSLQAGLKARFELTAEQREDYLGPDAGGLKITIPGLILNIYYLDLQTEEAGNYLSRTNQAKQEYLANGLFNWGRDKISSALLFTFSLAGLGLGAWNYKKRTPQDKERILIVGLATLGMSIFSALLVPWQRYAVAVLPFAVYWIAAGMEPFLLALEKIWLGKPSQPTP